MKTFKRFEEIRGTVVPQDRLVFTGPPAAMSGSVLIENNTKDHIYISSMRLDPAGTHRAKKLPIDELLLNMELAPGQKRAQRVKLTLDASTPPGVYESEAAVGGVLKKLTLDIQPFVHVEVHPSQVHCVGIEPGMTHRVQVLLVNKGNVPLDIPAVDLMPTVSADSLCGCLAHAVQQSGEKGAMPALEVFTKKLRQELAEAVRVSVEEAGQIVAPGETVGIHLILTISKSSHAKQYYEGELKLLNQKLTYRIIAAAHGPAPGKTFRKRAKP